MKFKLIFTSKRFSYSYELLNLNQWTGVTNIGCSLNTPACVTTGTQVLTNLSMNSVCFRFLDFSGNYLIKYPFKNNWSIDWIALSILLVGWRIITFLVLLLKTYLIK